MLVIGIKGQAKDALAILTYNKNIDNLYFYDDFSKDVPDKLYDMFPILKSEAEAEDYFKNIDKRFTIGVSDPMARYFLANKFEKLGGVLVELVCQKADVCCYDVVIEKGVLVSFSVAVSNSVTLKKGCLINSKTIIAHDCIVGEYTSISPSCNVLGYVQIGDFCQIGTGVIIYPNVKIGDNVIISAGSIVRKDIESNSLVHGNPARVIKKILPIKLEV